MAGDEDAVAALDPPGVGVEGGSFWSNGCCWSTG